MCVELLNSTDAQAEDITLVYGKLAHFDNNFEQFKAILGIVRSGSAEFKLENEKAFLRKDDIFFMVPNENFCFNADSNTDIDIIALNLTNPAVVSQNHISQEVIRNILLGSCTHFAKLSPKDSCYENILDCFEIILLMENNKPDFYQLMVYGRAYQILYELFSNGFVSLNDGEIKSKKYNVLHKITNYIDKHYSKGVSLEEVSDEIGISRYYVSHLFKELLNTTFVGYVNELRLNHAASLLLTTDLTVIEVAAQSGFNNLSNFNRAFKLKFGKTPSAYRRA